MSREPYHVLDPLFARLPYPYSPRFELGTFAGVTQLKMARLYRNHEIMGVFCYVVGDTLIDTGLACYGDELRQTVRDLGIRRAVLTHHHEDHAGNAAALRAVGVEVLSSGPCAEVLRHDLPIRFYEHLVWGKMPAAHVEPLATTVRMGRHEAQVIPAPGHCHDQVVFHVPEEGWLFSGDAFIHERVKIFRRDEDFAATLRTLSHLTTLDFDVLLCAHRPRASGGKAALVAKLGYLREIEEKVRHLDAQGRGPAEIAHSLGLDMARPTAKFFTWLTVGDATAENVVRSILSGPRHRPEIARLLPANL